MIDDDDLAGLLRVAADDIEVPVVPALELTAAGRRRVRRRRTAATVGATSALAVTAVAVPLAVGWLQPTRPDSPPPPADVSGRCVRVVPDAVLPPWARDGFSQPRPRMPYVTSSSGSIVAILFGRPLSAPPAADHANKILWVTRPQRSADPGPSGSPDLRIDARLAGTSDVVRRTVPGGPGPSIIDLPEPGCWQLTLHWSGHTDQVSLAYTRG